MLQQELINGQKAEPHPIPTHDCTTYLSNTCMMWKFRNRVFSIAIGTFFVLLFVYCTSLHQFLLCSGDECWFRERSLRVFLAGHPIHPIRHVQNGVSNVYFSIKTTTKYEGSRLPVVFLTWFQTVPEQNVSIITW